MISTLCLFIGIFVFTTIMNVWVLLSWRPIIDRVLRAAEEAEKVAKQAEVPYSSEYTEIPVPESGGRAYLHMRDVFRRIAKVRKFDDDTFPLTPDQCNTYRERMAVSYSRQNPDLDRTNEYEAAVDQLVEQQMWNTAPRRYLNPCVVCKEEGYKEFEKGFMLCYHHYMEQKAAEHPTSSDEEAMQEQPLPQDAVQRDAYLRTIHGEDAISPP